MLSATITHPWGGRTTLGGGCGSRTYSNVGANTIQAIIAGLQQGGATVTGNNPWTIDTHQASVMLRGTWDANAQTITVEVTDSAFWAPCGSIWDSVDGDLKPVIAANPPAPTVVAPPPPSGISPELESFANEAVDKSDPSGGAVDNVVNIFRLIPSADDRNTLALRASAIAAAVAPGKVASIQASFAQANTLTPPTVPPTPGVPTMPLTPTAATPAATGMSTGAKIALGVVGVGAVIALTTLVGRRMTHHAT